MTCPSCGAAQEADVDVCFSCGRLITALTQGSILAARYEILTLLGKGGMGVVYKAQDRLLDEPVAIKVLRSELMNTPELARRFRSEIKLARKVTHTNVCRIHEYGEDGPLSYISMALIEGTDLRKLLRQQPEGLPTEEAFEASIQSADGLQAIHAVGIIHRDLKTPNIVRDDQGIVRLMDFGIAKEADRNAGLTATGEVMGTPEYMSPEQCRGDQLDFKSDIYSLAIVVYELFTGRVPFHGETVMSTLLKQLQEPPPLDGPAAARLPASVVPVLRRALSKQPSDRHGSAAELAEALRAARRAAAAPPAVAVASPPPAAPEPPTTALPPTPALAGEPSGQGAERRRDSRLGISVDLRVARQQPDGSFGPDERTLADNIGRRGARVLTADDGAAANDVLRIHEHGGDFETRAAVRHVSVGADGIRRLGVEFLDRQAPDRLLPYVEPKARPRRGTRGTRKTPHTPVQAAPPPRMDERRRDNRLGISFDLILRRTGPTGTLLEEERTIADNVGRQGVRVMTTMSTLSPGDVVSVEEVGGPFRTRAVVRNQHVGTDRIRRVGLEFLDRQAPSHLIPSEDRPSRATPRPTPDTAGVRAEVRTSKATETATAMATPPASTPAPARAATTGITAAEILSALTRARARSHFEVLGVPSTASEGEVREAGQRLTKRFHPDAPVAPDASHLKRETEVVFIRVAEAYEVLRDPGRRTRHERMLGLTPSAPPSPPPRPQQPPPDAEVRTTPSGVPAASVSDADSDVRLAAHVLKEARALLAQERNWDAVRKLEDALELAPGTKVNQALRVLLAQATGKNPKWQKRAEEILLSVIQENANTPDAHLELGVLYKRAGLKARAAAQFRTVLQLRPSDPLAEAELAGLN